MDDPGLWVQVGLFAVLLLASAFFSGSETAFFSLDSLEKDALRSRTEGRRRKLVQLLFAYPDEVLVTILTGNMFVNIFATSISEALGARIFAESAEIISIAAMTVILLLVGEMTPKNFAIRHALGFSGFAARILTVLHPVLRPVVAPLGAIRRLLLSAYPGSRGPDSEARNLAVLSAIRMGFESNTIDRSELALLERFFRFREKTAADVMVPRVDVISADASDTLAEVLDLLRTHDAEADSRLIPVSRGDLDHIAGYVKRVDLVPYRLRDDLGERVSRIVREAHAVPASKPLRELAAEMAERDAELAIVVDEYGGTLGVISYDAMVDYLFDEFRPPEARAVQASPDGSYRIAGTVEIVDLEEILGVELEAESRTVGGMIAERLGELPKTGVHVQSGGYVFTVLETDGHRVVRVEARPVS
jgi:CBS domain containing-hemolysin-like protein